MWPSLAGRVWLTGPDLAGLILASRPAWKAGLGWPDHSEPPGFDARSDWLGHSSAYNGDDNQSLALTGPIDNRSFGNRPIGYPFFLA